MYTGVYSAIPFSFHFPEHSEIINHVYDPAADGDTMFTFGDSEAINRFYVLDLNSNVCDMNVVSVALHGPNSLIIYNGQLLNVRPDKIIADAGSTIILSDIHLELADDSLLLHDTSSIIFHGNCVVHGTNHPDGQKKRLINNSNGFIKIAQNSSLSFDNVVYEHANDHGTFLFIDRTSQLCLRNACFELVRLTDDVLRLAHGTLTVEREVFFNAGTGKIALLETPDNVGHLVMELKSHSELRLLPSIESYAPGFTMEELRAFWSL